MASRVIDAVVSRYYRVKLYSDVYEKAARGTHGIDRAIAKRGVPAQIHQANAIFVHIPKNGGTSVSECLYGRNIGHRSALFFDLTIPDAFRSKPSFAILRDPKKRFISASKMLLSRRSADVETSPRWQKSLERITSVDDILSWMESSDVYGLPVELRSQGWYVQDDARRPLVSKLFLLERDTVQINAFVSDLTGRSLPHKNKAVSEQLALTDSQDRRVESYYDEDFELIQSVDRLEPNLCDKEKMMCSAQKQCVSN